MLIECIIKRKDGTRVELDNTTYHFAPSATDPRHLAEVLIKAHAERFLSISEGYRYAGDAEHDPARKVSDAQAAPSRMPRTSNTHAAIFSVGERSITLQELTIIALRESGLSVEEWNAQEDQDLYEQLDIALEELRSDEEAAREAAANLNAPIRGAVLQPEPEEGLSDPEEDEAQRLAIEKAVQQGGSNAQPADSGADDAQANGDQGADDQATNADNSEATDSGAVAEPEAKELPSHDELVAAYKDKMGRAPSSKLSDERIAELLAEDDE